MRINNVEVYGLEKSIIASSYPKLESIPSEKEIEEMAILLKLGMSLGTKSESVEKSKKRAKNLGSAKQGSGHDCYLKGIIVQMDVTAPQYWWLQQSRYAFADIVSSQSKMHKITNMSIDEQCNKWVTKKNIEILENLIHEYNYVDDNGFTQLRDGEIIESNKENLFQIILSNTPMGLNLTARVTDNYLSLKTQYNQRKHHTTEEWKIFCKWIEGLPYFKEITGIKIKEENDNE